MLRVLLCVSLLAGCAGRPLTENERAFAATLQGTAFNPNAVRIIDGAPTKAVTFRRNARPRTTCRERILPPATSAVVTAKPAAIAVFNRVLFDDDWYVDDYLPDYPDKINLVAAMLFAHEMTHVWQWQNRDVTGYHPLKAASEHNSEDPYLFDLDTAPKFLDFGFEQQGAIVEEFVCCRTLAPQAPRTKRLHAMISQSMPVGPLPAEREHSVLLPWDGVQVEGICG